jgi:hypothetical protein
MSNINININSIEKKLSTIYKISRILSEKRKFNLIEYMSYKSDKIQLVFENISNSQNIVFNYY